MAQMKIPRTESGRGPRTHARAGRRLFALMVATVAILALGATTASAKVHTIHMEFNDAVANLGGLKGAQLLDPSVPDPPATLDGTLDRGFRGPFTVQPEDFVVPSKTFQDVLVPGLNVTVGLTTDQPVTGRINPGTGVLTADVSLNADIVLSGILTANCHLTGAPLHLATSGQLVNDTDPANPVTFDADRFAPASRKGAVVGLWDSLPPLTGDAICGLVNGAVAGPGGIWLSGTARVR